jgi:hypothetical protein
MCDKRGLSGPTVLPPRIYKWDGVSPPLSNKWLIRSIWSFPLKPCLLGGRGQQLRAMAAANRKWKCGPIFILLLNPDVFDGQCANINKERCDRCKDKNIICEYSLCANTRPGGGSSSQSTLESQPSVNPSIASGVPMSQLLTPQAIISTPRGQSVSSAAPNRRADIAYAPSNVTGCPWVCSISQELCHMIYMILQMQGSTSSRLRGLTNTCRRVVRRDGWFEPWDRAEGELLPSIPSIRR